MGVSKRKTGQQSILRRFYKEAILVQRDFRFEIEHEPEEVIEALNRLWRRDDRYYGIDIHELAEGRVWQLRVWDKSLGTEANATLLRKDELSILEGTAKLKDMTPLWFILVGILFLILAGIIILNMQNSNLWNNMAFILSFSSLVGLGLWGRNILMKEHQRLLAFLEKFMIKEENRLEAEWEKLYKKEKISRR